MNQNARWNSEVYLCHLPIIIRIVLDEYSSMNWRWQYKAKLAMSCLMILCSLVPDYWLYRGTCHFHIYLHRKKAVVFSETSIITF